MPILLILAAVALCALSGVPGLFMDRRSMLGQRIACVVSVAGSVAGTVGVVLAFMRGGESELVLPWSLLGERVTVAVDGLSAFFLVPVLLMNALGSVYGLGYWAQHDHPQNGRKLRLLWGWAIAGMLLLLVSRHLVFFLFGWDLMALSAFMLVSTEDHEPEVRRAGWLYLLATHIGTMALIALFALLHSITHSFGMRPLGPQEAGLGKLSAAFLLALLGFGLKAGIMPLHFWLPTSHANAPSHVSALMSGVLIKMGVYGLVRFLMYLPNPPVSWGGLVLLLGTVSAVGGVLYALGQHDLKRLLAYHSVENIGIIVMGLGLAMIGQARGRPEWVVLGMAGCLLHVWNHGLFKPLLFLGAGSVIHATDTRMIDRMGGLAKRLPWTAALFFVGALAICGLPPLNGFVSEVFIYLGLLRTEGGMEASWSMSVLTVPFLALTGALALACFVKVYGAVFMGTARDASLPTPHEAPRSMLGPMVVLAVCCGLIGVAPWAVAPLLDAASDGWVRLAQTQGGRLADVAPLQALSLAALALAAILGGVFLALRAWMKRFGIERAATWGCGYAQPSPRIQYTASSFAQLLTSLFQFFLRIRARRPVSRKLFPSPSRFETHVDDWALDRTLLPAFRRMKEWFSSLRCFQRGLTHHYLAYILFAVAVLLAWVMPIKSMVMKIFMR